LPPIVPDPDRRHEPFPLSDVQQAYWIGRLSSFDLGNIASHSYTEIDIPDLQVERFNEALRRVIERHDILRAIVLPDGRQQILATTSASQVAVQDLRGLAPAVAEAALARVREEMSHQMLPLDRPPLFDMRLSLLDGRTRLHLSLDYLVADAWSAQILWR